MSDEIKKPRRKAEFVIQKFDEHDTSWIDVDLGDVEITTTAGGVEALKDFEVQGRFRITQVRRTVDVELFSAATVTDAEQE